MFKLKVKMYFIDKAFTPSGAVSGFRKGPSLELYIPFFRRPLCLRNKWRVTEWKKALYKCKPRGDSPVCNNKPRKRRSRPYFFPGGLKKWNPSGLFFLFCPRSRETFSAPNDDLSKAGNWHSHNQIEIKSWPPSLRRNQSPLGMLHL